MPEIPSRCLSCFLGPCSDNFVGEFEIMVGIIRITQLLSTWMLDGMPFAGLEARIRQEALAVDDGNGNLTCRFPVFASRVARWHRDLMEQVAEDEYCRPFGEGTDSAEPEGAASERTDEPEAYDANEQIHVFRGSTTNHDDWLHRGDALLDLDLYQYVVHIERVRQCKFGQRGSRHRSVRLERPDPHALMEPGASSRNDLFVRSEPGENRYAISIRDAHFNSPWTDRGRFRVDDPNKKVSLRVAL